MALSFNIEFLNTACLGELPEKIYHSSPDIPPESHHISHTQMQMSFCIKKLHFQIFRWFVVR